MPNVLMLDFLADLRENNSLDWMHAHEKRKKEAQNAFLELVQGCIADLAETEPCLAALDAKDLVFRINRDTRFSDDKSPYNPTFRAHISPAGRMPVPVGYFVSVTPGGSFAGGGLFAPHFKDATRMVRDRIAADPQAFLDIVEAPGFAERFRFVGMPLKNVPKGYDPQSPAAEYLKCKCWAVEEHFDDAVVADDEACRRALLDSFAAMKTFNEYLNEALEGFAMPTR
ncbi:MAG: DUF2461 domain-containing protein [Eggerthella lenta]|uniref:DUF2461 domain-containing protein n=1 Tax=Eggerthella sp. TaxID=1929886 RepID=UPI00291223BF|nr:DUF2461 domain-containing protein [Eggerthella sp.]MDU6385209.1 DUF2461 domain-containing protein [Eggerthella sp.]